MYKLKRHVRKLIVIVPIDEVKKETEHIDQHVLFNEENNQYVPETKKENEQSKLESSKAGPN